MSDLQISLYDFPSDLRDLMEMREEAQHRLATAIADSQMYTVEELTELREGVGAEISEIDKGLALYYEALPKKVDDLGAAWKWLESLVGTSTKRGRIDAEIDRLRERKATFEARLTSIKTMVQYVMEAMPWKPNKPRKLDGARHTLYLKGNGGMPAVEVYDESLVTNDLCTITVTVPADIWMMIVARTAWSGLEGHPDGERRGVRIGRRVPSLSAIGEALAKPCEKCGGSGDNPSLGVEVAAAYADRSDRMTDEEHASFLKQFEKCPDCGGTGRNSVAGARLKPVGQHVECR